MGREVLDIEEEFLAAGCYVRDAYKRFYSIGNVDGVTGNNATGGPYKIHLHSNGLCFITLAPTHPLFKDNLKVTKVEFPDNRMNNKVSGKRKRGGQFVRKDSILCTVTTECGQKFTIRAAMEGKLMEINRNLITNPEEIKSETVGYIAILESKWVDPVTPSRKNWIPEDDFAKMETAPTDVIKPVEETAIS